MGVESAASWSPVGRASNWTTKAGLDLRFVWLYDVDIPKEKWLNYSLSGSALFASYPFRGLKSSVG